jgi:hypothetical protein
MSVAPTDVDAATFGAAPAGPLDPIERDQYGRPLIPNPDGKTVGHTRASSAGKPLEDVTKLTEWKERQVTIGTLQALLADTQDRLAALADTDTDGETEQQRAEREVAIGMLTGMAQGLMLRLEEIGPEPDKDLLDEHGAWKAAVNDIVKRAHEAAGSKDRADLGTYLHSVLDARFKGEDVPPIPDRFADRYTPAQRDRDVDAYDAATVGWVELCRERFVVCDAWTIAGTLDSLVLMPIDQVVERTVALAEKTKASRMHAKNKQRILAWCARRLDIYVAWKSEGVTWVMTVNDLKSGRRMDFVGLAYTAQVATYSDAVLYDPETQERAPFSTLLPADVDPAAVRMDVEASVIVHVPVGEGACRIYDVPLDEGRAAIAMACDVRAMRNDSRNWLQLVHEVHADRPAENIEPVPAPSGRVDRIDSLIRGCQSIGELRALREREMVPVETQVYGRTEMIAPWTAAHEEIAAATAALLQAGLVGHEAKPAETARPESPADELDPVLAEIERAETLPRLRGVWAVYKDTWTPERDAAAAARAEALNAAKAAVA